MSDEKLPNEITLRRWYAGMALQVLTREMTPDHFVHLKPEELARGAFLVADAMIAFEENEKK